MRQPLSLPCKTGDVELQRLVGEDDLVLRYQAQDAQQNSVLVEEYAPKELCRRHGLALEPTEAGHRRQGQASRYTLGLEAFLDQARRLSALHHRHVHCPQTYWSEHSTAYVQYPLLPENNAITLHLPQSDALRDWLLQGLDALEALHNTGLLHGNLTPQAVYRHLDGTLVLAECAAARRQLGLALHPAAGFAPPEFYASDSRRWGPWSDVYALAAVAHQVHLGQPPQEASVRVLDEAEGGEIEQFEDPALGAVLERALCLRLSERFGSVAEMRAALLHGVPPTLRSKRADPSLDLERIEHLTMRPSPTFDQAHNAAPTTSALRSAWWAALPPLLEGFVNKLFVLCFLYATVLTAAISGTYLWTLEGTMHPFQEPRYVLDQETGMAQLNPTLYGTSEAEPIPPTAALTPSSEDVARTLVLESTALPIETPDPRVDLVEEQRLALDTLLLQAEESLAAYRLTSPAEESALHYYEQALQLDPQNETALAGFTRISDRYLDLGQRAQAEGNTARALRFIELGLSITPEHAGLSALEDTLKGQMQRQREQQVSTVHQRPASPPPPIYGQPPPSLAPPDRAPAGFGFGDR